MSFLFGSAPSVKTTTAPTINPSQQGLMDYIIQAMGAGQAAPGTTGGAFIPDTINNTIQQLYGNGLNATVAAAGNNPLITGGQGVLQSLLQGGAPPGAPQYAAPTPGAVPQITQPGAVTAQTVAGPTAPAAVAAPTAPANVTLPGAAPTVGPQQINASQAFQQGVAQPLIDDFTSQVLPSISGAAGRSAGGAYSSDTQLATALATKQLGRTLAQQGSLYDFSAQQANQQAALTAALSNASNFLTSQGQGIQAQEANQSAGLTTNAQALAAAQGNQQAGLTTNQQDLAAALANQQANLGAQTTNLGANLQTQTTNQSTDLATILAALQSQLSTNQLNAGAFLGQGNLLSQVASAAPGIVAQPYSNLATILNQVLQGQTVPTNESNAIMNAAVGLAGQPTQQTNSIVNPGQAGVIPSVIGGLAGNSGVGLSLGSSLSRLLPTLATGGL